MYTELLALCTESSRIHHKDIISVQKTFLEHFRHVLERYHYMLQ